METDNVLLEMLATFEPPESHLDCWDGLCGELADSGLHYCGPAALIWFEHEVGGTNLSPSTHHAYWNYHVALYIDGFVHCAWFEQVVPIEEYAARMFPNQDVVWSIHDD